MKTGNDRQKEKKILFLIACGRYLRNLHICETLVTEYEFSRKPYKVIILGE